MLPYGSRREIRKQATRSEPCSMLACYRFAALIICAWAICVCMVFAAFLGRAQNLEAQLDKDWGQLSAESSQAAQISSGLMHGKAASVVAGIGAPKPAQHEAPSPEKFAHINQQKKKSKKPGQTTGSPAIVALVHNRDSYIGLLGSIQAQLDQLGLNGWQVYVSCDELGYASKIQQKLDAAFPGIDLLRLNSNSPGVFREDMTPPENMKTQKSFQKKPLYKISRHFEMALEETFSSRKHSHAIFIEDDLAIAPDFLQYFSEAIVVLDQDPSIWCVSAWNDNGHESVAVDSTRLLRSGFFPGLGWMIKRELWVNELRHQWPSTAATGWDHWMRQPSISKGRDCIIPEVSRSRHVLIKTTKAANVNSKEDKLLKQIKFASRQVNLDENSGFGNLDYLLREHYIKDLKVLLQSSISVKNWQEALGAAILLQETSGSKSVIVPYTIEEFSKMAPKFFLWKSGPRGTFEGIMIQRAASFSSVLLLFIDKRSQSALVPEDIRIRPNPRVVKVAGEKGQSCTEACATQNGRYNGPPMVCDERELAFLNSCEDLKEVGFACEGGCGHQVGRELPAYVVCASEVTFQQCLATSLPALSCEAKHACTRRVCPCVPAS